MALLINKIKEFKHRKGVAMEKRKRLYNVMFPFWMLIWVPITWVFVIPFNILWDGIILNWGLRREGFTDIKTNLKTYLPKVVLLGFLADFIGSAVLMILAMRAEYLFGDGPLYDLIISGVMSVYSSAFGFVIMAVIVFLVGVLIYQLNKKITFKNSGMSKKEIHKISLRLAIFTAPYSFFIPINWLTYFYWA